MVTHYRVQFPVLEISDSLQELQEKEKNPFKNKIFFELFDRRQFSS